MSHHVVLHGKFYKKYRKPFYLFLLISFYLFLQNFGQKVKINKTVFYIYFYFLAEILGYII